MQEQSYEKKLEENPSVERLELPLLKYFWQSNPMIGSSKGTVPKFLRKLPVLSNFGDYELYILSKYLHKRTFQANEMIFNQGELGVGFYFIFSGHVDIVISGQQTESEDLSSEKYFITLEKSDYFGELALLQDKSIRNASAIAKDSCVLLGLLKPDLEILIESHPVIAAKLLQSTSLIIANRLFSLTKEVAQLKYKIKTLESKNAD